LPSNILAGPEGYPPDPGRKPSNEARRDPAAAPPVNLPHIMFAPPKNKTADFPAAKVV